MEAASDAGAARFRPIVLTSLTTFAGLTPLLREGSVSAKFLIPMAISLGYGVAFATVITLFLVPCLYLVLDDLRSLWQRLRVRAVAPLASAVAPKLKSDGVSYRLPMN
jgi:Cu/Ag efflux pump CusA